MLLETFSQEQLDDEVRKKTESFQGLLTREAALRLIAKEKGILKEEKDKSFRISEIKPGARRVNVDAKVRKVFPLTSYPSGTKSRKVEIADDTGSIALVLWNDDCELAKRMKSGDRILVKKAYEKNGALSVGYSGIVEIAERAPYTPLAELKDGEHVNLREAVKSVEGHDRFVRGTSTRPGFSFTVSDGKSEVRCIIWDDARRGERLEAGDEVIIENVLVNRSEISVFSDSRIFVRKKSIVTGKVESIDCRDDKLVVNIDGKEFFLGREKALKFLGASIADDVELSTVVSLKKDSIVNTNVVLEKPERKEG